MSSFQALYPEYTLYNQWTEWNPAESNKHSERLIHPQDNHKAIRVLRSPSQLASFYRNPENHPDSPGVHCKVKQECDPSPSVPTRSMSWPSSVCPSSNITTDSTWSTTPPSDYARVINSATTETFTPYFTVDSFGGHRGGVELDAQQNYHQSTEWHDLQSRPLQAQAVHLTHSHNNSTDYSFSPPPAYPSQPVNTVKQEEEFIARGKPIYGLFPNFGAWQSTDADEYSNKPSTGVTPAHSPPQITAIVGRKRKRSESARQSPVHKRFKCEFCGFAFDRKCNLTCHLKVHDVGRKEVQCPTPGCNKTYGRRADANRHVRTFHNKDQHTCNYCGKSFVRTDILTRHLADACPIKRRRKNALPTPPTASPYQPSLPPLQ